MQTNVVYHADFRETMACVDDNSVGLILTDPPYGIDYTSFWKRTSEKIQGDSSLAFMRDFSKEAMRVLIPGGRLICFGR